MKTLRTLTALCVLLFLAACNPDNQGNTPANTEIKGTIAGNPAPASLRTISGTVQWPPLGLKAIGRDGVVCELSQSVALVLEDADGERSTWAFEGNAFEFEFEVETEQTFRLFLTQDETTCGELHYSETQSWSGLKTIISFGEGDVELGELTFYDNGLIFAANDPARSTDHDGDGVIDAEDADVNGDGQQDADLDYNGLIDWSEFEPEQAASLPTADACDVLFLWPSDHQPFLVSRATHRGLIALHTNDEVEIVTAKAMRLLDQDDKPVKAPFSKTWLADTPMGPAIAIETIPLILGSSYTLIIPPGSFTCQGGESFQNHIEIEFVPYPYLGPYLGH